MQTFKVKLKLNKLQKQQIDSYMLESIDIYNTSLDILLAQDRLIPEFSIHMIYQISDLPAWIAQNICGRAYKAVERFKFQDKTGKKFGKPRFKTEKIKGNSFAFSVHKTHAAVKQFGRKITINIPKLGKVQGLSDNRDIQGQVKQVAIKCDTCGDYWATIVTDNIRKTELSEPKTQVFGVDLGLKHTVTASNIDGTVVIQPKRDRILDKNLDSLKFASNKDRKALPHIHRKIVRRRQDNNWKLARNIIATANYTFVGDVSPQWLLRGKLARSAADTALFDLKTKMSYLAESAGRHFEVIPEAYTSKTCSCCGTVKKDLKLSERVFQCSCGFVLDRDLNAARNIARKGWLSSLEGSSQLRNTAKKLPEQALDFSHG